MAADLDTLSGTSEGHRVTFFLFASPSSQSEYSSNIQT